MLNIWVFPGQFTSFQPVRTDLAGSAGCGDQAGRKGVPGVRGIIANTLLPEPKHQRDIVTMRMVTARNKKLAPQFFSGPEFILELCFFGWLALRIQVVRTHSQKGKNRKTSKYLQNPIWLFFQKRIRAFIRHDPCSSQLGEYRPKTQGHWVVSHPSISMFTSYKEPLIYVCLSCPVSGRQCLFSSFFLQVLQAWARTARSSSKGSWGRDVSLPGTRPSWIFCFPLAWREASRNFAKTTGNLHWTSSPAVVIIETLRPDPLLRKP